MDYNAKFDIDLDFGKVIEKLVRELLESEGSKLESKSERANRNSKDKKKLGWLGTRNIAIEISYRGKPSGLSITEADWWSHALTTTNADGSLKKVKCILFFPVDELKSIVKGMVRDGKIIKANGGDSNESELLLLPIKELADSIGKYF